MSSGNFPKPSRRPPIGVAPSQQLFVRCAGVAVGSVAGVPVYNTLIVDPRAMLLTQEWMAPPVAIWKAVVQTLTMELASLSPTVCRAILLGGPAGLSLKNPEIFMRGQIRFLPSAAGLGLSVVLPASVSLWQSMRNA